MKPIFTEVKFDKMPQSSKRKICPCKTHCKRAFTLVTHNDGMSFCYNEARKLMYEMISQLDEERMTTWTDDDMKYIVNLIKEKGIYYGINRDIADTLGKSYTQVKSKVRRMKMAGIIK